MSTSDPAIQSPFGGGRYVFRRRAILRLMQSAVANGQLAADQMAPLIDMCVETLHDPEADRRDKLRAGETLVAVMSRCLTTAEKMHEQDRADAGKRSAIVGVEGNLRIIPAPALPTG